MLNMKNLKRWVSEILFFSLYKEGKRRGVAILISNVIKFELISQIIDIEGRFALVKGKIDQKEGTLFNVYAPPGAI